MSESTRRDVLIRGLVSAACAPVVLTAVTPLYADSKDKGSSFMLYFRVNQTSKVVFDLDFVADENTREMTAQIQQESKLSKQTFWRPLNMVAKSAGTLQNSYAYKLLSNQFRLAVGLTAGYTYSIKITAQALNNRNRPVGDITEIASRSGHT